MLPDRDAELVQIVEASLNDATRRSTKSDSTSWLSCAPGCTECCHGVFRITALDAERLRAGLRSLEAQDPPRAEAIYKRAENIAYVLRPDFPGDPTTGVLSGDQDRWEVFSDLPQADAACPVLDPVTGRCELYTSRPLTCRIFGPPVQNQDGIGMCHLCYAGATEQEILQGELHLNHQRLEEMLDAQLPEGDTIITWAVLTDGRRS
ncbi:MAG: YkgJ family cysteine cluster protein [Rhodospirillales bacterium]|nr:YkgJ family cysteine cluster protein [Acetobacter sp.]